MYNMIPNPWNVNELIKKHPITYENSMEAVLFREVAEYNRLIIALKNRLTKINQAVRGFEMMTSEMEISCKEILAGHVPKEWKNHSYLR